MRYKLRLKYTPEGPQGEILEGIESPIFDFPNPIMPGQSFTIFGRKYVPYGGDNGSHFVDENGAYTVIDLCKPNDLYGSDWKPDDVQSRKRLEDNLDSIKQDFVKLGKID